mgnify:CR=1 FL=1
MAKQKKKQLTISASPEAVASDTHNIDLTKTTATEAAVPATEATAPATEAAVPAVEAVTPVAENKGNSKSVVSMAITAAVLIVAIGCWGYFVTPKLGTKPMQQQNVSVSERKATKGEASPKSRQPPPTARTTSILFCLHISIPLRTDSTFGFGSIPEHSKISIPEFLRQAQTES